MPGRPQSLTKGQREEVKKILSQKVGKWVSIVLFVLTPITGFSLWQIYEKINSNMERILAEQFEDQELCIL